MTCSSAPQTLAEKRSHSRLRPLLRAAAHRGGMARQLEALPGVADPVAADPQHRQIRVDEIADIKVAAVGAEHRAFRQFADRDLADFCHLLAGDLEDADGTARVIVPLALRLVR